MAPIAAGNTAICIAVVFFCFGNGGGTAIMIAKAQLVPNAEFIGMLFRMHLMVQARISRVILVYYIFLHYTYLICLIFVAFCRKLITITLVLSNGPAPTGKLLIFVPS